jgi:hypothetical protein
MARRALHGGNSIECSLDSIEVLSGCLETVFQQIANLERQETVSSVNQVPDLGACIKDQGLMLLGRFVKRNYVLTDCIAQAELLPRWVPLRLLYVRGGPRREFESLAVRIDNKSGCATEGKSDEVFATKPIVCGRNDFPSFCA